MTLLIILENGKYEVLDGLSIELLKWGVDCVEHFSPKLWSMFSSMIFSEPGHYGRLFLSTGQEE